MTKEEYIRRKKIERRKQRRRRRKIKRLIRLGVLAGLFLIAIMVDDEVRLAFNTCQVCQGSPWAWFEYLGDGTLECQNCHQTFKTDIVGTAEAAGCCPVTISDFTVDGNTVIVPAKVLSDNAYRFENWKQVD